MRRAGARETVAGLFLLRRVFRVRGGLVAGLVVEGWRGAVLIGWGVARRFGLGAGCGRVADLGWAGARLGSSGWLNKAGWLACSEGTIAGAVAGAGGGVAGAACGAAAVVAAGGELVRWIGTSVSAGAAAWASLTCGLFLGGERRELIDLDGVGVDDGEGHAVGGEGEVLTGALDGGAVDVRSCLPVSV